MRRLGRTFFARDAVDVARDLIGARLVVGERGEPRLSVVIVETEAYRQADAASHAFRGPTARNASMFGPAGHAYVYFIYGLHFCLNLVTGQPGDGAAVLIRSCAARTGRQIMRDRRGLWNDDDALCRGPGNVCRALGIDRSWDGADACAPSARLRLYAADRPARAMASPRIGVRGDDDARAAPWRFHAAGELAVSQAKGQAGGRVGGRP